MNERFKAAGRRALVTGASSGIGRAIARGLHEMGAEIVLHHFGDAEGAEETSRSVAGAAVFEADFTRPCAAARLGQEILSQCGAIDIVIANAAIERRVGWTAASDRHIADHISANLLSLIELCQTFIPPMQERGWGRVVAIGSVLAERPRAETLAYASAKAGQLVALRAIARDVARMGVTMNVVSPGAIEIEKNAARYADTSFRDAVVAKIPAGRPGLAEDVAGAVLFLCSGAAAYITGADIPVDGGWTIGDVPGVLPGEKTG